ncbi:hypothetical protein Slin15195_G037130 [Septoria linicola]|uniref:Uncharacterized protein n=1 Tax=Septoria linicola TaxID=215465 RepID=A0A9Q9ALR6_9PEZI|nr:hypothetical protein Slin15195_G037130 [Septoria linicola]
MSPQDSSPNILTTLEAIPMSKPLSPIFTPPTERSPIATTPVPASVPVSQVLAGTTPRKCPSVAGSKRKAEPEMHDSQAASDKRLSISRTATLDSPTPSKRRAQRSFSRVHTDLVSTHTPSRP